MYAQEPEFTDKSVVANKEYQYRVTAENEGGESKPSEPSDLIKAKALRGLFLLSKTGLNSPVSYYACSQSDLCTQYVSKTSIFFYSTVKINQF